MFRARGVMKCDTLKVPRSNLRSLRVQAAHNLHIAPLVGNREPRMASPSYEPTILFGFPWSATFGKQGETLFSGEGPFKKTHSFGQRLPLQSPNF